ncbi:SusC/RagA family TonB-linked outer membrane protein [Daejeonella oryzae]|uniref:SusC/RagA family TonB-linked outer membrane protein n=1 Tax=Daejeonella oryzae TaxID=1122943 RepID=UPI0004159774|nr:TonB-dependent receptor [Daejeonella oryzae]
MKKLLQSLFLLLFVAIQAIAQVSPERTVTGTVTGEDDGLPLPGVSVKVKGSNMATQTSANGKYSIVISGNTSTLVFSYVGYAEKQVPVGSGSTINVALQIDNKQLSEVVVVGYGTQSRALSTQTISSVNAESFKNVPVISPQQILQGQAAGVNMVNSSGILGAAAQITVRGGSSLNAGGQPLYVVDGVPLNTGAYTQAQGGSSGLNPLLNINANDIESLSVLKDASAVAIYGSRGANGVVLIKTKSGAFNSKGNINFDYYTGYSEPTDILKYMNADQWRQFRTEYLTANNLAVPNYPTTSFDWADAVVRTGKVNNFNLNAAGGSEKTKYFVGGTFSDESGYTLGNDLEKLSGRFNFQHNVSDKVRFGLNYNLARVNSDRIGAENSTYAPLTAAYLQLPYVVPYDADGNLVNTGFVQNVIGLETTGYNTLTSTRNTGNAFAEVDIIKGLTFKTDWGIDNVLFDERYREVDVFTPGGYAYVSESGDNKWLTQNTLTYNRILGQNHTLNALLGYSFETARNTNNLLDGSGFASDDLPNLGSASTPTTASQTAFEFALESQFARLGYGYADKYLFEGSLRRDGSSRFGQNSKYGIFYALSAGWVLSNENFFNKDSKFAQFLKLTASYGTAGNDNIGYYNYLGTFAAGAAYSDASASTPNRVANPNLSWEETAQLDVGLTARVLNALDVQLNYYNKLTTGLLANVPYPFTTGFAAASQNVGELRNRGFEITLGSQNIKTTNFTWNTNFNIGFNKNTVLSLPENRDAEGRNFILGSTAQRAIEGESRNSFYVIRYKGINPETGDAEWLTKDGTPTTTPVAADRVLAGHADPDFVGGFTNSFRYKSFDLSAFFNFAYGNKVLIDGLRFTENFGTGSYNKSTDLLDYWKQPGDNSFAPRLNSPTRTTFQQLSTSQLQDGSYARLKTVTLGYNFSPELLGKTKLIRSARIYALGQNLLTIQNKDFRGPDPEVSANGASNGVIGESFFALPQAKSITFGINLGF